MTRARDPRADTDLWGGLALIGVALLAAWLNRDLRLGSLARMGPGFFPLLLSVGLGVSGLALLAGSLAAGGERMERWHLRPVLFLSATVATFGLLVQEAGLFLATSACVAVASLARPGWRAVETLVLALAISALVSVVFVLGLGLPLSILPG